MKKVLMIIGIILALIIILYLPIPIGEDIQIYTKITTSARSLDGGKSFLPGGDWAPDNYIITKQGFVHKANSSFAKKEFIGYLNLFEKIRTKFRPGGQQPTSEVKDIKFNIEQEAKKNETKKGCC